jgi:diketogulonate reductase-like aldo/keto reductase
MDVNPRSMLLDGNEIPLIGLGTMNFRPNDKTFNLTDFLTKACEIGYQHFDLAKFFENEVQIGDAFKAIFDLKKPVLNEDGEQVPGEFEPMYTREEFYFSLKVYNVKGKSIVDEVKASLVSKVCG